MSEIRTFGFQTVSKSELFCFPISDKIFNPKSERFSLDFGHFTSLDRLKYKKKIYKTVWTNVRFRLVRISDRAITSETQTFLFGFQTLSEIRTV